MLKKKMSTPLEQHKHEVTCQSMTKASSHFELPELEQEVHPLLGLFGDGVEIYIDVVFSNNKHTQKLSVYKHQEHVGGSGQSIGVYYKAR